MVKRNFTEKEKIVFYGIVRYPGINDNALSKIIDINASTIATIRNKLKKKNYFQVVRIPYLQHCGYELISVSYDRIYLPSLSEPSNLILGNIFKRVPNVFYLLSAPDSWLAMGFYQNYYNLKRTNELIRADKYHYNLQEDTEKQIIFPFGLTRIYNLFDYSEIIRNFFELEGEPSILSEEPAARQLKKLHSKYDKFTTQPEDAQSDDTYSSTVNNYQYHSPTLHSPPSIKFTKAEREVFLALIQYPELSDFAINKKISISATSINNIRKKFESQAIIKQFIVPNLNLLGFELVTLTHLKFRSFGNLQAREEFINKILLKAPNILYLASNTDEIILGVFKNFSEYQQTNDEISKIYRDNNMLASEPRNLLFPLGESTIIKEHTYVPIVNQLLGHGKSIIDTILEIISKKIGETGKQILVQHLESIDLMTDTLTAKDIPELIEIIQDTITPIFGSKSATEIASEVRKLKV